VAHENVEDLAADFIIGKSFMHGGTCSVRIAARSLVEKAGSRSRARTRRQRCVFSHDDFGLLAATPTSENALFTLWVIRKWRTPRDMRRCAAVGTIDRRDLDWDESKRSQS